jgi:hypothetical protein
VEARQGANAAEATGPDRWKVAECSEHRCATEQQDSKALRQAQDWEAEEVERDVATEDWINGRAVGGVWHRVLPERNLFPVGGNLCANEESYNDGTDAECAVADRGASASRCAITIGAEESAQCVDNPFGLQISTVIHKWGSWLTWCVRACCRASRSPTKAASNEPSRSKAEHEECECRKGSAHKEATLQLQALPVEGACAERIKPARIGEERNDRAGNQDEHKKGRQEERAEAKLEGWSLPTWRTATGATCTSARRGGVGFRF